MIHAKRFPQIGAVLIALLVWSPCTRLEAQGQGARIRQTIASARAENKVAVKDKRFGPARMEGGVSLREGSVALSVHGRPSRTIRIKVRQKATKAAAGVNDQSITAIDESTGQESVWSFVDEAGAVTLALSGTEKLKITANPDGTLSVNGTVYRDEATATNAAGQTLAATDLVPESAQAVAETIEMLLDENPPTSRAFAIGAAAIVNTILTINLFVGLHRAGRL